MNRRPGGRGQDPASRPPVRAAPPAQATPRPPSEAAGYSHRLPPPLLP